MGPPCSTTSVRLMTYWNFYLCRFLCRGEPYFGLMTYWNFYLCRSISAQSARTRSNDLLKLWVFIPSARFWGNALIRFSNLGNQVSAVFRGFFRGPHREGRAPPYAEKVRFRRAGIKKAHAVILCWVQNQTVHRRTAWACKEHIITFQKRKELQLWH